MTDDQLLPPRSPMAGREHPDGVPQMTRDDWLTVGLKLMGVVFAVYSLAYLAMLAGQFAMSVTASTGGFPSQPSFGSYFPLFQGASLFELLRFLLFGSLQQLTYLVAAYLLIRKTDTCLKYLNRSPTPC